MWNNGRGVSPSCRVQTLKSQVEALSRGGVPVLSRISRKPSRAREADISFTAGRPSPPLSSHSLPIQMRPRRVVPAVTTTVLEKMSP